MSATKLLRFGLVFSESFFIKKLTCAYIYMCKHHLGPRTVKQSIDLSPALMN